MSNSPFQSECYRPPTEINGRNPRISSGQSNCGDRSWIERSVNKCVHVYIIRCDCDCISTSVGSIVLCKYWDRSIHEWTPVLIGQTTCYKRHGLFTNRCSISLWLANTVMWLFAMWLELTKNSEVLRDFYEKGYCTYTHEPSEVYWSAWSVVHLIVCHIRVKSMIGEIFPFLCPGVVCGYSSFLW